MGIKPTFSSKDIEKSITERVNRIENAIIERLKLLGEKCVIQARVYGSYRDITGNLRSSVGYVITSNGKVIKENFNGDSAGTSKGKSLAKSIANEYQTGHALIVVAGMHYAVQVESRGRDVLTSAELLAEYELPQMMKRLKTNISKMS